MGDTWWVIIICPCVNVFSLMGGVTEADVGFPTVYKVKINEVSKEHWKIKIYFSVLFLRTWRSGILFQPNITIFDIYMKGKTCIHLKLSHF